MTTDDVRPWLLITAGIAALAGPFILAYLKRPALSITAVAVGATAVGFLAIVPDLESFGFGPLNAKVRSAINEANATVEQLRDLATTLTRPVLGAVSSQGRLASSDTRAENLNVKVGVVDSLKKLKLSDNQLKAATEMFDANVRSDLFWDIYRISSKGLFFPSEKSSILQSCFGVEGYPFPTVRSLKSVNEMNSCIKDAGLITDEIQESFADLEYFDKTRKIRRMDVYLSNGK